MRHELPHLLGAFSEPGNQPAGPSFGAPFQGRVTPSTARKVASVRRDDITPASRARARARTLDLAMRRPHGT